MTFQDILYQASDGIVTLTLNRPKKLNAFRSRTITELSQALVTAIQDRSVGVIVVTGSGGKAFSVGGDIGEMKNFDKKSGRVFVQNLLRLGRVFLTCPKPIVAKVNGYCIGGGNEIQLFCDLTIASDKSVFGQTGPKVGSAPLWGGSQILPLLVGLKKTKEVAFLCKQYSAAEAEEMGMINRVVPEAELDQAVDEIAHELLKRSPQSLRLLKKSLHRDLFPKLVRDLKDLGGIYGSAELKEGMGAFLEKREPDFFKNFRTGLSHKRNHTQNRNRR